MITVLLIIGFIASLFVIDYINRENQKKIIKSQGGTIIELKNGKARDQEVERRMTEEMSDEHKQILQGIVEEELSSLTVSPFFFSSLQYATFSLLGYTLKHYFDSHFAEKLCLSIQIFLDRGELDNPLFLDRGELDNPAAAKVLAYGYIVAALLQNDGNLNLSFDEAETNLEAGIMLAKMHHNNSHPKLKYVILALNEVYDIRRILLS